MIDSYCAEDYAIISNPKGGYFYVSKDSFVMLLIATDFIVVVAFILFIDMINLQ